MAGTPELDLRSLKTDMRMDVLRTKSPGMVRKEVAMHLLAYNLIGGVMAEAARAGGVKPGGCASRGPCIPSARSRRSTCMTRRGSKRTCRDCWV